MANERSIDKKESDPPAHKFEGESRFDENLSKKYKSDPSIQNYVKLRRANPEAPIEVGVVGGLDQLFFMEPELRKYGFDPFLVVSTMDADPAAIAELSLQIMEKLIQADALEKSGETHLASRQVAVPDKLIEWLIKMMLDALSWNDDLYLPRELIVLIRERLGGASSEYEDATRTNRLRSNAIDIGAQIRATGQKPSFRRIGKILGVSASTVNRWFPNGEFLEEVERQYRHFAESGMFDQDGNLTPTEKWNFFPPRGQK